MNDKEPEAEIIGFGLDNSDGHLRKSKGENFSLYGGSEQTHEQMQESCIKMNEKLSRRGKTLQELEKKELTDIANECGMNLFIPDNESND